jgi:quercetin dioxygenase-like cupin family protein
MRFKEVLLINILFLITSLAHTSELLKTTTTWEGQTIRYPLGEAEVTSVRLTIAEGEITKFHCHPVPTLGYILNGTVEVETINGDKKLLKQGESVAEVLRTVHRGKAIGGKVEIIVFYAGTTNIPNTVFPEDDPQHVFCND